MWKEPVETVSFVKEDDADSPVNVHASAGIAPERVASGRKGVVFIMTDREKNAFAKPWKNQWQISVDLSGEVDVDTVVVDLFLRSIKDLSRPIYNGLICLGRSNPTKTSVLRTTVGYSDPRIRILLPSLKILAVRQTHGRFYICMNVRGIKAGETVWNVPMCSPETYTSLSRVLHKDARYVPAVKPGVVPKGIVDSAEGPLSHSPPTAPSPSHPPEIVRPLPIRPSAFRPVSGHMFASPPVNGRANLIVPSTAHAFAPIGSQE